MIYDVVAIRRLKTRFSRYSLIVIFSIILFSVFHFLFASQLDEPSPQATNCSQICPYSSKFTNNKLIFDEDHFIRHFPSFVCPQNFRNLADWIYSWPDQFHEHIEITTDKGETIAPCLPDGSIIYVRIWAINEFFNNVYPHLKNKFVLITGEGDLSSPVHLEYLDSPDSKIIHWFGQNGQYHPTKTKKFTHIPIGINCYEMANAIQYIYSQNSEHKTPPVFHELDEPDNYIQPRDISARQATSTIRDKELVLINFDAGTDKTGLRKAIWKNVCAPKYKQNYTFIKCLTKEGGVQINKLPQIYERNRQYPLWLSPRGNGIDCHRTWEALYLDIIPIIWNNSISVLFEHLPVIFINKYEDLNVKDLVDRLREISQLKLSKKKVYQYERLRNAYWRRLILSKSRHRKHNDIYQRTKVCWRAKSTVSWSQLANL